MSDSFISKDQLTARGHRHVEAFCLMWYQCKQCGHMERIWNSRDGVTPFGMMCPSCGGHELYHAYFGSDLYAPDHQLRPGQRFWRDGTPDEAERFMQQRIDQSSGTDYECSPEQAAELIRLARSGESHEFQAGWPMIETKA